jgi:hypothetical protein
MNNRPQGTTQEHDMTNYVDPDNITGPEEG